MEFTKLYNYYKYILYLNTFIEKKRAFKFYFMFLLDKIMNCLN